LNNLRKLSNNSQYFSVAILYFDEITEARAFRMSRVGLWAKIS
jgi:hypothetical protein